MKKLLTLILITASFVWGESQNLPLHQIDLKGLNGERTNLDEVIPKGKTVILSFWATWCGPCKKELDAIHIRYDEWQEKYSVVLIAISTDDSRTAGRVKATVLQKKWPYDIYQDIEGESNQIFNFQTVPFTAILDSEGNLAHTHIGYTNGDVDKIEKELAALK